MVANSFCVLPKEDENTKATSRGLRSSGGPGTPGEHGTDKEEHGRVSLLYFRVGDEKGSGQTSLRRVVFIPGQSEQ